MEETTTDSNSQNKVLPNGKSIESSDCDEESTKESIQSVNSSQNVRICLIGSLRLDNEVLQAAQSFGVSVVLSEEGSEWEHSAIGSTIFVVEDFNGPVFDKLHGLGHRILGPVALRELVDRGSDLPRNTRPLYTLAMWGLVICFTGFHKKDELVTKVRMTVDGGTSHWYKFCENVKQTDVKLNSVHPDIVCGDFDSISQGVFDLVNKPGSGSEVIKTPDQDHTDFRKALHILSEKNLEVDSVIAVAETSGRLDHVLANINIHFVMDMIFTERRVNLYSLSSDSLTWLLWPGKHSIMIPKRLRDSSVWCSLLPVGGPSVVTTTGLHYNMCNTKLEFGVLVSSSNTYSEEEEEVNIVTNNNIIWSMGLGFSKS